MYRLNKHVTKTIAAALLMVAPVVIQGQNVPKAQDQDQEVEPPSRQVYFDDDGMMLEFDAPVVPDPYIYEYEELEATARAMELDAFDLEANAFDLQLNMMENYQYDFEMTAPFIAGVSFGRSSRGGVVEGQEPVPNALPQAKIREKSKYRTDAISYPRTPEGNRQKANAKAKEKADLKATYQAAYSLILDSNWLKSGAAMQAFIEGNYQNRYTDDASFWFVYSLEKQENATERVFDAYYAFVSQFPSSSWADDAKANLISIGSKLVTSDPNNRTKYEPILTSLRKDNDIEVAISALYGLSRIGDEKSLQALIRIYDDSENEILRKNVVTTLARFEEEIVVKKLAIIAQKDADKQVRATAFTALARSNHPDALKVLREIARNDADPDSRGKAVSALGRGEATVEVITVLEEIARTDVHVKVRTKAVTALGRLGTPEAQEALIRILSGN